MILKRISHQSWISGRYAHLSPVWFHSRASRKFSMDKKRRLPRNVDVLKRIPTWNIKEKIRKNQTFRSFFLQNSTIFLCEVALKLGHYRMAISQRICYHEQKCIHEISNSLNLQLPSSPAIFSRVHGVIGRAQGHRNPHEPSCFPVRRFRTSLENSAENRSI